MNSAEQRVKESIRRRVLEMREEATIPHIVAQYEADQAARKTFRDEVALEALKCSLIQAPHASNRLRCEGSYALADEMIRARNKRDEEAQEA